MYKLDYTGPFFVWRTSQPSYPTATPGGYWEITLWRVRQKVQTQEKHHRNLLYIWSVAQRRDNILLGYTCETV